jgi:hypothetical protein
VPRVAGIEDPTTHLLTENEESQKKANGIPSKAHGLLPKPKSGSGACILHIKQLHAGSLPVVLKACDAARSHTIPAI